VQRKLSWHAGDRIKKSIYISKAGNSYHSQIERFCLSKVSKKTRKGSLSLPKSMFTLNVALGLRLFLVHHSHGCCRCCVAIAKIKKSERK
jgi:hypothetical protein